MIVIAAWLIDSPDEFMLGIWWIGFMFGTFFLNPDTFSHNPIYNFKHHGASHNIVIWILVTVVLLGCIKYMEINIHYGIFILGWFSNGLLHIIMDASSMIVKTVKNNFFKF